MSAVDAKIVRTMCPMNCHPTFCGMRKDKPAGSNVRRCNGMSGGAPGALLKRPSREAPAGNGAPVGPIRLPEL